MDNRGLVSRKSKEKDQQHPETDLYILVRFLVPMKPINWLLIISHFLINFQMLRKVIAHPTTFILKRVRFGHFVKKEMSRKPIWIWVVLEFKHVKLLRLLMSFARIWVRSPRIPKHSVGSNPTNDHNASNPLEPDSLRTIFMVCLHETQTKEPLLVSLNQT